MTKNTQYEIDFINSKIILTKKFAKGLCLFPQVMRLANSHGKKMRVYRIDHMQGVEVEKADAEGLEEFKKIKLSDYTKQTFGMYSGELQSVTMRFPNNMVGTVLDRFGREVTLMKADDRHFRITVPIAVSPQFYGWVFGLKNMVTIESPQSVVDGMKEMLAAVEKRYEDPKGLQ